MIAAAAVMLIGLAAILIPAIVRNKRQYHGPKVLRWQNGRWVATYRRLK